MALDFPVIFLLPTHLESDELLDLEEQIPSLTYDIDEAEVVLGKVSRKERALFELRKRKLATEEVATTGHRLDSGPHSRKRTRTAGPVEAVSDTGSDAESEKGGQEAATVKVVKLAWFTDSVKAGKVLPLDDYVIYEGRKTATAPTATKSTMKSPTMTIKSPATPTTPTAPTKSPMISAKSPMKTPTRARTTPKAKAKPQLTRQNTSEHEIDTHLPPIPEYLHTTYSCQRPTFIHPPNETFIDQLIKIRTARTLTGDKIGIRAYSSAIATLSAYPYTLSSAKEVARLPGCGNKIALLFREFKETGHIKEAEEDESDPKLVVLKLFYEIWGVAETMAREFYNKGWRDRDDVIEYGWDSLTRVQQIGVKFYDEFQLKIPRAEVESISNTILKHARGIRKGFQMVVVGGYRRGKLESGDVDVVLSHPDEAATVGFVERIVVSLERAKFITHTLTLSTKNSERGQTPVSWKGNEKKAGVGFDTLDKALVVWQDPEWTSGEAKNPNPHRRVDIIVSPWKTAGCAVLGWSSGTTFQRDLRRYCKKERSLKFDSSGIRSRADGSWVDFESGPDGQPAPDMLTAERRVFAGLGLEYRPPEERCTG